MDSHSHKVYDKYIYGPKDHINISISHSFVPRTSIRGIPETMVGGILMFRWPFGAHSKGIPDQRPQGPWLGL